MSCHEPTHGWGDPRQLSTRWDGTATLRHDRGGTANPWLSPDVKPLNLTTREQADLVAFLEALTGQVAAEVSTPPTLPE